MEKLHSSKVRPAAILFVAINLQMFHGIKTRFQASKNPRFAQQYVTQVQWSPDSEPPRETKIGSKNQKVGKIRGKISVRLGRGKKTSGSSYREVRKNEGSRNWKSTVLLLQFISGTSPLKNSAPRAQSKIPRALRASILLSSGLDWIVQLLLGAWGQGQASWAMQEFPRAGTVTSVSAVSTI